MDGDDSNEKDEIKETSTDFNETKEESLNETKNELQTEDEGVGKESQTKEEKGQGAGTSIYFDYHGWNGQHVQK